MEITDADVHRVARALTGVPTGAYTTPVVYPWAVQNFEKRPFAERHPLPAGGRLYVHVPFCRYHCTFCFYAVRCGSDRPEMERYIAALSRELDILKPGSSISRLTVGGGTPSALPPDLLDALFNEIRGHVEFPAQHKCKIEASPDSISSAHLEVMKEHRIGWVSLGIESLEDPVLGTLTRRHTARKALDACRLVVDSGLRLNVDLIYGLPGQTQQSFFRDLAAAATDTGADSLCLYALRLNRKTRVAAQLNVTERMDLARLMRWRAFVKNSAEELGFEQKNSYTFTRRSAGVGAQGAAAKPVQMLQELGIGMSGRSQLGETVYRNHERFKVYLDRVERGLSPVETLFELDTQDRKTQFMARTLGAGKALERSEYQDCFGQSVDADFGEQITRLIDENLLEDHGRRIMLSEMGRLVYDRILLCFYSDRAVRWLGAVDSLRPRERARRI